MSDLEKLLEPISDDDRAGPDMSDSLEVESVRGAFETDFKFAIGISERDSSVVDAPTVKWSSVFSDIKSLSSQTKDLYLGISYARCGFPLGKVDVVDTGLQYIAGLIEGYWEEMHPRDEDGPDVDMRSSYCQDLVKHAAFALPFLKLEIAVGPRVSLTAEQCLDVFENGAASQDHGVVVGFLNEWEVAAKEEALARLDSILASFAKIQTTMSEHCGADAPNFADVTKTISSVRNAFVDLANLNVEEEVAEDADVSQEGAGSKGGGGASFSGKIHSREDVVRALTEIESYYSMAEPGHPVKVSIARLKGWVNKDFMEILRDIAPDSVREAEKVLLETENSD